MAVAGSNVAPCARCASHACMVTPWREPHRPYSCSCVQHGGEDAFPETDLHDTLSEVSSRAQRTQNANFVAFFLAVLHAHRAPVCAALLADLAGLCARRYARHESTRTERCRRDVVRECWNPRRHDRPGNVLTPPPLHRAAPLMPLRCTCTSLPWVRISAAPQRVT